MFLFACYACGLRISDILKLTWKNIEGDYLQIKMKKTDRVLRFKLLPVAKTILNELKIRKNIRLNEHKVENRFIFPFLDHRVISNLKELDRQIGSCTAYYNKDLRIIAEKCKIEKHISSHVARHSFATIALRQGMPIEYVSKLLGHKSISTTQIYAKIINTELDKALYKLDF